jgi:translation elongation factor EF-G
VTSAKRIHIYGHVSAQPQAIANLFGGEVSEIAIAESDLAIFAVNPAAGIDQQTINLWQSLSDFQLPRLVVVNELEGSESDFEDAIMLGNRVFDQLATPFLVLHGDKGEPVALINLQTQELRDYSTNPPTVRASDFEHQELVADFREEYLAEIENAGEGAFAAGLLFPAIPVVISNQLGIDVVNSYIDLLN